MSLCTVQSCRVFFFVVFAYFLSLSRISLSLEVQHFYHLGCVCVRFFFSVAKNASLNLMLMSAEWFSFESQK